MRYSRATTQHSPESDHRRPAAAVARHFTRCHSRVSRHLLCAHSVSTDVSADAIMKALILFLVLISVLIVVSDDYSQRVTDARLIVDRMIETKRKENKNFVQIFECFQ